MCGRRLDSKIAFCRTTMKVESHWSLINRIYLLPSNRPRFDLLFHIIDTKLLPTMPNDFDAYYNGTKNPYGERSLLEIWKSALQNPSATSMRLILIALCDRGLSGYEVSFLWKDLIRNDQFPHYHQVTINFRPPFVEIDKKSTRFRAKIDVEERDKTEI